MKEYRIKDVPPINTSGLDKELKDALGALCLGISTDSQGVRVHLADKATASDEKTARDIVMAHDASSKSAADLANERRAAATVRLEALDLTAITGQVEAASAGDDLRPQLLELSRALEDVLEVLGYGAEPKS